MSEREIHKYFCSFLDARQIPYRHDRTDKRTRTTRGEPDFLITWMGRCLYIEVKVEKNKLSPEQEKRIAYLRTSGNRVEVCHSVEECIEATKNILCGYPKFPELREKHFAGHLDAIGGEGCKVKTETYY